MIKLKKFINFIYWLMIGIGFQMPIYCAIEWLYKTKVDFRAYIGIVCSMITIFIVLQLVIKFKNYFKIYDI